LSSPLKVAAFGIDQRSREMLRMIFSGPARGICTLVDETSAQAGIVNMDCAGAEKLFEDYRKRLPELPTITIAIKQPALEEQEAVEDVIFVKKPISVESLIDALKRLRAQVGDSVPAGTRAGTLKGASEKKKDKKAGAVTTRSVTRVLELKDEPGPAYSGTLNKLDQPESVFFDPSNRLLGSVMKARKIASSSNQSVKMELPLPSGNSESIIVSPRPLEVVTDISEETLKTLCTDMISEGVKVTPLTPEEGRKEEQASLDNKAERHSLESFLWATAVWSSRGSIPQNINVKAPVLLRHWPNFTRLIITPNALRIAALWVEMPHSPLLIAKVLRIPLHHVLVFYTAAYAIGLIGPAKKSVTPATPTQHPAAKAHRHRSLFKRILDHLKRASD